MTNATPAASGLDPQMQAQIQAQMADIIEPAAIGHWPIAWGWWLLIAAIIALLSIVLIAMIQRYRHNRYRRFALNALQDISKKTPINAQQQAQQLMQLSKQVGLHAYPSHRHSIATAHGEQWLQWLNTTTARPLFADQHAQQWQRNLYAPVSAQASADTVLITRMQQWIKDHYSERGLDKINMKKSHHAGAQHV
ncbi:DUF4381 domain-containing protein [Marinagarivorans algicola]|uniref:DUF4381 domain-containing protein n=1 Tax=Marinagarivorans algicola TaxID=1513270 RepID=UPI0006B94045|nr:DUF4381 domain-containing protein [Marinagarivorans algicola]